MAARTWMHIDVHDLVRNERARKTRFFDRFAKGCLGRRFAIVDVAPRLHPDPEPAVLEQHDPARADDEGRARHVNRIGVFVERVAQARSQVQELCD